MKPLISINKYLVTRALSNVIDQSLRNEISLKFLKLIFLLLVSVVMLTHFNEAHANSCELIQTLRVMAKDHFKAQRGKRDNTYYDSTYLIPGSSECYIRADSLTTSELTCSWFLVRGIDKKSEVKNTFEGTVKSFQNCIPDGGQPKRMTHKSGIETEESVWLQDVAPAMISHLITISYIWSPPWWKISIT